MVGVVIGLHAVIEHDIAFTGFFDEDLSIDVVMSNPLGGDEMVIGVPQAECVLSFSSNLLLISANVCAGVSLISGTTAACDLVVSIA